MGNIDKRLYVNFIGKGILLIVSLILLIITSINDTLGSILLSIGLIIEAIFLFLNYKNLRNNRVFKYQLILSLLIILFAICLIVNIYTIKLNPLYIIGIYLIVKGLAKINLCFEKLSKQPKVLSVILVVLTILLGIIAYTNPLDTKYLINQSLGIFIILSLVLDCMCYSLINKNSKTIFKKRG